MHNIYKYKSGKIYEILLRTIIYRLTLTVVYIIYGRFIRLVYRMGRSKLYKYAYVHVCMYMRTLRVPDKIYIKTPACGRFSKKVTLKCSSEEME